MKRVSSLLFVILWACALLPLSCTPRIQPASNTQPKPLQVIWSGTSAGYPVRWTSKEISAGPNHPSSARPVVFSDTGLTILDFSEASSRQTGSCDFQRASSILSLVGPWLSLRHNDELKCGDVGEPTRRTQALVIDLNQPKQRPLLTEIFPDHAVLLGLVQATPLKNTLAALHARPPQSSLALVTLLANAKSVCGSKFPKDFLNRFAFVRVQGSQVLTRLGLPLDCKASEVTLWLPIPAAQIRAFALAASKKQGFLMAAEPAIANGRETTILYHVRTSSGSR